MSPDQISGTGGGEPPAPGGRPAAAATAPESSAGDRAAPRIEEPAQDAGGRRATRLMRAAALAAVCGVLGFASQPLHKLLSGQLPAGQRVAGLALLAAIAFCYLKVMWTAMTRPWPTAPARPWRTALATPWRIALPVDLATLAVLSVAAPLPLGRSWLALGFILPAAAFAGLRWPGALYGGLTALAAAAVTGLLLGAAAATPRAVAQDAFIGAGVAAIVLLTSFAGELRRTRSAAGKLTVAQERLRLARDLHDDLWQNLSAISLKSELAMRVADCRPQLLRRELDDIHEIARESLRGVRAVEQPHGVSSLDGEIQSVRSVLETAGIRCDFGPVPADLAAELQDVLGWAVREAAVNVLRHSEASICQITSAGNGTGLVLEITNDGAAPQDGIADGSGLTALAGRLAAVGGQSTARTASGWFRLRLTVPRTPVRASS